MSHSSPSRQSTLGSFLAGATHTRTKRLPSFCLLREQRFDHCIKSATITVYLVPLAEYHSLACHESVTHTRNAAVALHYRLSHTWNKYKTALEDVNPKHVHIAQRVIVPYDRQYTWE